MRERSRRNLGIAVIVIVLLALSGSDASGWAGILFPLMFLFFAVSAVVLVLAPFAVSVLVFYLVKRRGVNSRSATLLAVTPLVLFLAWPLSGLVALSQKCEQESLERSSAEKLGPIDAMLVDGPGMWWLNGKIDVERPEYGKTGFYWRREAKRENKKHGPRSLSEDKLRSQYKVTIEQPQEVTYLQQCLTSAYIKIEDRTTGAMVARVQEPVWGGGLAGNYIAALTILNPFYVQNRYLSCGYAGHTIGLFRGSSKERSQLYRSADQRLIEQVFILAEDK